ncbi:hypothetical protein T05_5270, partial [Trichinella murrelli]
MAKRGQRQRYTRSSQEKSPSQEEHKPFRNDAVGNAATDLRVRHVANYATLAVNAIRTMVANTAETSHNL